MMQMALGQRLFHDGRRDSLRLFVSGSGEENTSKGLFYKWLSGAYTFFLLLAMGIGLGLVSLYFGAGNFKLPMFFSYFSVPYLLFLNLFPAVFLIFFLYFVFNRVWAGFLAGSVVLLLLTWIDYFKLLFRNDPLMAADLCLFSESVTMAGRYNLRLDWKIICVLLACIAGTLFAFFLAKARIRSIRLRLSGLLLLAALGIYLFSRVYMNVGLYNSIKNEDLINKWSATQVYISKGFLYPFLHSIKAMMDETPEGYREKEAGEKLLSYEYSDIPGDKKVNVIAIQFEAFNDFSKFPQIRFNTDVYGFLHQLEAESYAGELVTNIFAGGTEDTERSFLTGYTTLRNYRGNVNSYVRYFAEQGYTVEGSHPCYGWFYNRQNVNLYLGFQHYYFFENMYAKLAKGYIARDKVLLPQIIKLYEANKATSKPYFSFNVTYQNHGPYSTEKKTDVQYVVNQGYPEEDVNIMNNYFDGINSTIQELKQFVDYFRSEKEPVVLILFGDHNPWMGDNKSVYRMLGIDFDLGTENGFYNYYDTPYVIWGNDSAKATLGNELKGKGPRIGPYFLMNEFFKLAGYKGNEFMKASDELKSVMDVVHSTGRYKEAGVLTEKPSPEAERKLEDFLRMQYYWSRDFREEPEQAGQGIKTTSTTG
jgi:phosphoglycerol transferase MdoB-like AlkP superfamily enzyme